MPIEIRKRNGSIESELHTAEGKEERGPKPKTDTLWGISDMETILRRGMARTYDVCTRKGYTKIR